MVLHGLGLHLGDVLPSLVISLARVSPSKHALGMQSCLDSPVGLLNPLLP